MLYSGTAKAPTNSQCLILLFAQFLLRLQPTTPFDQILRKALPIALQDITQNPTKAIIEKKTHYQGTTMACPIEISDSPILSQWEQSPLLRLSGEIRNSIYEYVLPHSLLTQRAIYCLRKRVKSSKDTYGSEMYHMYTLEWEDREWRDVNQLRYSCR